MYCKRSIETNDAGWGYMQTDMTRDYYHVECLEQYEGVVL